MPKWNMCAGKWQLLRTKARSSIQVRVRHKDPLDKLFHQEHWNAPTSLFWPLSLSLVLTNHESTSKLLQSQWSWSERTLKKHLPRDVYLPVTFFLNWEEKKHRQNISIPLLLEMSYVSFYKASKKISVIINKNIKKNLTIIFCSKIFWLFLNHI